MVKLTRRLTRGSFLFLLRYMSEETLTETIITVTEAAARQVAIVRKNEPENADKTQVRESRQPAIQGQ